MISIPKYTSVLLARPNCICAVATDKAACKVLKQLEEEWPDELKAQGIVCRIFPDTETMNRELVDDHAVLLFDRMMSGRFSPTMRSRGGKSLLPPGTKPFWGVALNPKQLIETEGSFKPREQCSHMIGIWFLTDRFLETGKVSASVTGGGRKCLPWGDMRKDDSMVNVRMDGAAEVLKRLNSGPNFARCMAHSAHAAELPADSRISWVRVPDKPVSCDMPRLQRFLDAFREFERACCKVAKANAGVREELLAGVAFAVPDRLRDLYLNPPCDSFSVRRLDLHVTVPKEHAGSVIDVAISESDEMPGGFPDAFVLDAAYEVNAERWESTFSWLLAEGPLVFLVSSKWSSVYVEEVEWLVNDLVAKGHDVHIVTTDKTAEALDVRTDGVHLKRSGAKVGTIWRLVPIFEFDNELVEIAELAAEGKVRMVPEFSHLGNKAWFALYRRYKAKFAEHLSEETLGILDAIMPESFFIDPAKQAFDVSIPVSGGNGNWSARSLTDLRSFTPAEIDNFVLKVCGANPLSARSYGVLMGHNLSQQAWNVWIDERVAAGETFIVQRRFRTSLQDMPIHHTKHKTAQMFRCRMLMRPWEINGKLVSAPICAVPHTTERVHGMVDMAMVATNLSA